MSGRSLELSRVASERNDAITLGNEFVRPRRKLVPITSQWFQQILEDRLRPVPGAAVVRETLGLGPSDVLIKQRKDCRHIAASQCLIEIAHYSGCFGHGGFP